MDIRPRLWWLSAKEGPGWQRRSDHVDGEVGGGELGVCQDEDRRRDGRPTLRELLAELVQEVKLGRVVGPTRPDAATKLDGWNISTTALLNTPAADRLQPPPPPGQAFVAAFFP